MTISFPQNFIIIDDNPLDQLVYEKTLIKTGLAQSVRCFGWAADALKFLEQEQELLPDTVVLVDLQMPVMNGFQFVEQFGLLPSTLQEKIKIFMLSSTVDTNDLQKARGNHLIVAILAKPLDIEHLRTFQSSQPPASPDLS